MKWLKRYDLSLFFMAIIDSDESIMGRAFIGQKSWEAVEEECLQQVEAV